MSKIIRTVKTFTINIEIIKKLRQLAFDENKKQNEIIEEALTKLFEERKKQNE